MSDGANIFVSHIHEDDDKIQAMKVLLKDKGFSARDASINATRPNEAKSEAYIKSGILAAKIAWASTMVVLISPGTKDSPWVNWEIEHAARLGRRIVGVWTSGAGQCDVPEALTEYGDAVVGWNGDRIIAAICGEVDDFEASDGAVVPPRQIAHHDC